MDSLRWTILALGIIVILGIYFWDAIKTKRQSKRRSGVIFNQDISTDFHLKPTEDETLDFTEAISDLNQVRTSLDEQLQESADFGDELKTEAESDWVETNDVITDETTEQTKDSLEDDIIILRIIAKADEEFKGLRVLMATKQVEMKFGNMNIFHHYGVGELQSEKPLFSLANMYEPGEFNLQEMEAFTTKGLVVYMSLPTPLSAAMSFELMLNTSQRLAEQLNGELRGAQNQFLDEDEIQLVRDKIRRYE